MIVVSDSSPLIILSKIGYFYLLPKLYSNIFITAEVFAEVVVSGMNLPGASEVANADWIGIKPITNTDLLLSKQAACGLGIGELSTILLAKEIGATVTLIDDLPARRMALAEGIAIHGTVGILEVLYAKKKLPDLREAFRKLLDAKAFVDAGLLNQRLKALSLGLI